MNLRQKINSHPAIFKLLAVVVLIAASIYIVRAYRAQSPVSVHGQLKSFYTIDDGVTLFTDDASKIPPFDHDGHEAVRAVLFTCDGGQHRWIQYLEKYADDAKRQMEGGRDRPRVAGARAPKMRFIKKPGESEWIDETNDDRYREICVPKAPPGMGGGFAAFLQPQ